jgi:hypothetical protein
MQLAMVKVLVLRECQVARASLQIVKVQEEAKEELLEAVQVTGQELVVELSRHLMILPELRVMQKEVLLKGNL